jgi:hypothetical protein
MPEIRHLLGIIDPSGQKVFEALTANQDLVAWLTPTVQGQPFLNQMFKLEFGQETVDLKVTKLDNGSWVQWSCTGGEFEWLNTKVNFILEVNPQVTIVEFIHSDWQDSSRKFSEWSFNWALYLRSLKKYCESGTGSAYPNQMT